MRNGRKGNTRQAGFAYLFLLLVVALIGLAASAAVSIGAAMARRDAEQQLLVIGFEYQRAIRSYAANSVAAGNTSSGRGPQSLEQLLSDHRQIQMRRHLRRLYADPLTGKKEWGLVRDPLGSIVGVYSLAEGTPIQRSGFAVGLDGFDDADSYADWVFGVPFVHPRVR
jgi:type II secretory pathway pseudopilin PulG